MNIFIPYHKTIVGRFTIWFDLAINTKTGKWGWTVHPCEHGKTIAGMWWTEDWREMIPEYIRYINHCRWCYSLEGLEAHRDLHRMRQRRKAPSLMITNARGEIWVPSWYRELELKNLNPPIP